MSQQLDDPCLQVIGSVNTVLKLQYKEVYTTSTAAKYVSDIAFAGTVVGQLIFGFTSDQWSRTNSLMVSTLLLIIFTALAAGSYYKGDPVGMFNILTAWRFFVGIGIGGKRHCRLTSNWDKFER
jgi:MFS family permease